MTKPQLYGVPRGKSATFVGGPLDGQSTTVAGAYRQGDGSKTDTKTGDRIRRNGTGIYALSLLVKPSVYRWLQRGDVRDSSWEEQLYLKGEQYRRTHREGGAGGSIL